MIKAQWSMIKGGGEGGRRSGEVEAGAEGKTLDADGVGAVMMRCEAAS